MQRYEFVFKDVKYCLSEDTDIEYVCCTFVDGGGMEHGYTSIVIKQEETSDSVDIDNLDALAEFLENVA